MEHLRANGFAVNEVASADLTAVKSELGVPPELESCHTATVGGYVIEGHVPADDIVRLVEERPPVVGLAVPGMPVGSPGMEVPGKSPEQFDVVSFDSAGASGVFATHP